MIYKFEVSLPFKKEFKALFKKYKSLDKDIQNLRTEIKKFLLDLEHQKL